MTTHRTRDLALAAFLLFSVAASAFAQDALPKYESAQGLTSATYQVWVERVARAGYRLATVNGYDVGGEPQFAALAMKDEKAFPCMARHDLSADELRTTAADLSRKGFRPICLSGYLDRSTPRFAAIWVKDDKTQFAEIRFNLTTKELAETEETLAKKGLWPETVTGYADGAGSYRFAALFVEGDEIERAGGHDLTSDEYQRAFDKWVPQGYRPTSVSVYPTPKGTRFAVRLVKEKGDYIAKHELTTRQFKAELERNAKAGYQPIFVAGMVPPKTEPVDFEAVVRKYMTDRNIPAGTLAVSRNGKMVMAAGYGFADADKKRPIRPEDPMRIASVTKPITAAAVRDLVRDGKISLDMKVFPYLGLEPIAGAKPDPRLNQITVRHLLNHRGGWDRGAAFDPMFRPLRIAAAFDKLGPAGTEDVIRYMMGQPLQFDPGTKSVYSNFGYCVLGRVIEKATGTTYMEHIRKKLLAPLGVTSVELGRSLPAERNPREPIYVFAPTRPGAGLRRNVVQPDSDKRVPSPDGSFYLEAMDAHGGLIASAIDLIKFLDAYWISGERREGRGRSLIHFGQLDGTYSMVMQRPNGTNIAALFNQWGPKPAPEYDQIAEMMGPVADRMTPEVRYAVVWGKR